MFLSKVPSSANTTAMKAKSANISTQSPRPYTTYNLFFQLEREYILQHGMSYYFTVYNSDCSRIILVPLFFLDSSNFNLLRFETQILMSFRAWAQEKYSRYLTKTTKAHHFQPSIKILFYEVIGTVPAKL